MRPRKLTNRSLPPNLYVSKKGAKYYYRYRHPVTGKEHGMGSDRAEAIKAAHQLNNKLAFTETDSLVERVLGGKKAGKTMSAYLDKYWEQVLERDLAANTLYTKKHYKRLIKEHFGNRLIRDITTEDSANFIDSIKAEGHPRKAQATRSTLIDVFASAMADGWIESNPASPTRSPRVKVQRSRLTLEQFNTILEVAQENHQPYVASAMLLAIVTGQRVGDIANMRFKDISDGWLHVRQEKTGMMLRIPLELRLEVVNLSLKDVVARCRDRAVSQYLIHHNSNHGNAPAGAAVHRDNISGWFRKARELSGLQWNNKPPSFHESRLYPGGSTRNRALMSKAC